MLKRFLKGLGIAFACSYALASPKNTQFIHISAEENNEYITKIEDLKIRDTSNENNVKQYLYKINILFSDNNYIYSNFVDSTNDFDVDFTNSSQAENNNYFLTLYICCYNSESGYYVRTRGYFNKLSYDEINNVFFISETSQANNYNNVEYLDYVQGEETLFHIEYKNAYVVIEDVIENNNNFSYDDFSNYLNNDNKKALEPLLLKTTNIYNIIYNLQTQAFNNGQMSGYDNGYNDGYNDGVIDNSAYQNGYNDGYDVGIGDNIIPKNIIGWFRILGRGIQNVLDIEILPYMKIGYIIGIPILFGLILFIVRLVRGD